MKLTDKNVAALTLPVGKSDLIEFDEVCPASASACETAGQKSGSSNIVLAKVSGA